MYISEQTPDCENHSTYGTIFGCLFKQCRAQTYDTGGLVINNPDSSGFVRSCVFDSCTATTNGGGIYMSTFSGFTTKEFLFYCFFNENKCGTGTYHYGGDVCIDGTYFSDNPKPFPSCYSTTGINLKRCMESSTNKDGWLENAPSPFIQYVNDGHENATDSYGCGISESFPCKTETWARQNATLAGVTVEYTITVSTYYNDIIYLSIEGDIDDKCGRCESPCPSLTEGINQFTDINEDKTFSIQSDITMNLQLLLSTDLTNIPSLTIKCNERNIMRSVRINEERWEVCGLC
jgi:predicted outer membrane repeat protein